MKLFLLFLILPQTLMAQTPEPDTTKVRDLGDITVKAASQRAGAGRTVYVPDSRQRDAASDGVTLLGRMHIPQLDVNPVAETVKTSAGQSVSFFINGHKASPQDVAGLNPADVRRVEILDFPTDPRFLRAEHVVHFILREYACGGYTKLSGKERFLVKSGQAAVYSKFACRQMEYDLMIDGGHDHNGHIGSDNAEIYKYPDGEVTRSSSIVSALHHERTLFTAFRAAWNKSERLTWRNLLSFQRTNTPRNTVSGTVIFSDVFPSGTYSAASPSRSAAIDWNSELHAAFRHGWSLQGELTAEMLGNTSRNDYTTSGTTLPNHARERGAFGRGDVQASKTLSEKISLFTALMSGGSRSKINYAGTSDTMNRFGQYFGGCTLGVSLTLQHLSGSIDAGYAYESSVTNGQTDTDSYPFTHVDLEYSPSRRHAFSLWFQYATMSPGADMKNPNMMQLTEMMYVAGCPGLKRSRHLSANVTYTWLPSDRWQLTAYASCFRVTNRQVPVYSPTAPGGMMLKRYANSGDYNHGQIGLRMTGKFLDGKLQASLAPRLLLYRTTGENHITHCPFGMSLSADYYLGHFFFNGCLQTALSYVDGETCYLRRLPADYSLSAGWAAHGWHVSLSAADFLRSSWRTSSDTFSSRWYDSRLSQSGASSHRRLTLTLTYTFNYGKKVSQDQEMQSAGSISSSILH